MTSTKTSPTKYSNTAALADRFGALTAEKKALEAEIAALKAELVTLGETVEGEEYVANFVSGSTRWTIDTKAITAEMGEEWVTKRSKLTNVSPTIRSTLKAA